MKNEFGFRWGKSRAGKPHPKRRTSRKRLQNSLKRFTEWCRQTRRDKLTDADRQSAQGGKWTTKADMPTARYALSTSLVDGRIYAIGGVPAPDGPPLSTVEVYDRATNTWTKKADMPTARFILSTSKEKI